MLFERFDANHDGKITKSEINTRRKQIMGKHDTDKNGNLYVDECQGVVNASMH